MRIARTGWILVRIVIGNCTPKTFRGPTHMSPAK